MRASQLRPERAEIKTVVSTKQRRRDRRANPERVLPFVRDDKPAIQRSGHVTTGVRAAERELAIRLMVRQPEAQRAELGVPAPHLSLAEHAGRQPFDAIVAKLSALEAIVNANG